VQDVLGENDVNADGGIEHGSAVNESGNAASARMKAAERKELPGASNSRDLHVIPTNSTPAKTPTDSLTQKPQEEDAYLVVAKKAMATISQSPMEQRI
jgi:hypothetical protein